MNSEYFAFMNQAITQLLTSATAGFLVGSALLIFQASMILRLGIVGAEAALLSRWDGAGFFRLVGRMLFVAVVLYGWRTPIAFLGVSAPHVVIDEAQYITAQLDNGQAGNLQQKLNDAYVRMQAPSWKSTFREVAFYLAVVVLIAAMEVVALLVSSLGNVVVAICVLFGPLFVAALMWPATEHLFRSWLNGFLQFAFYAPVAAAVIYITSFVLTTFWANHPGPIMLVDLPVLGMQFVVMAGSLIMSLLFVPAITNSIFSGRSGSGLVKERGI